MKHNITQKRTGQRVTATHHNRMKYAFTFNKTFKNDTEKEKSFLQAS